MASSPAERTSLIKTRPRERLHPRIWVAMIVLGLAGQLSWTVENTYLNVFTYETITPEPTVIATMVALSAIAENLATNVVGAWSDLVRQRRVFISVGYIAWGACTAAFGLLASESGAVAAPYVFAAVVGIIALDRIVRSSARAPTRRFQPMGHRCHDAPFTPWSQRRKASSSPQRASPARPCVSPAGNLSTTIPHALTSESSRRGAIRYSANSTAGCASTEKSPGSGTCSAGRKMSRRIGEVGTPDSRGDGRERWVG